MKLIQVQFTRNKAEYPYLCSDAEATALTVGQRVVVPTTMKDDGTVTLSIAHISGIGKDDATVSEMATNKPIVMALDAARLADITQVVSNLERALKLEAK